MQVWRAAFRPALRHSSRCTRSQIHGAPIHVSAVLRQHEASTDFTGDGATVTPALLDGLNKTNDPVIAREIEAYLSRNRMRHTTSGYGADVAPHYTPNDLILNPPSPADITVELLLASQTHLGHSTSLWNPANSRYIFGIREGIHILSPDVTAAHLRRAATIVTGVTEKGGLVLFAGTRKGHERAVVNAAQLAGGYHLFDRWMPGTITNGVQILGKLGTKLVDHFDREIEGHDEQLDVRPVLKPDLVVCFNPVDNYVMLHECGLAGIPTIGIVDTDTNPTWVTYPIPANDDSLRSVALIAGALGRAGEMGQKLRAQDAVEGKSQFNSPTGIKSISDEESDEGEEEHGTERARQSQPSSRRWQRPEALREMTSSYTRTATAAAAEVLSNGSAVSSQSLSAEDAALLGDLEEDQASNGSDTALGEAAADNGAPSRSRRSRRAEEAELEGERSEVV